MALDGLHQSQQMNHMLVYAMPLRLLKYLNVLIIIHLYWKTYVQLKFCNLEAIQTVWNMDDTSEDGPQCSQDCKNVR